MDLRTLRYFLAVTREGTISRAASVLHLTQPTLSKQMQDLEEELGTNLFTRGKRGIVLTEDGLFLRQRALELLELADKTMAEFQAPKGAISGEVVIGGGETDAMRILARAAQRVRQSNPQVSFRLFSGNAQDVTERLERGLLDFGLFVEPASLSGYDFLKLPVADRWGVLTRKDGPLAGLSHAKASDLVGLPLLISDQSMVTDEIAGGLAKMPLTSTTSFITIFSTMPHSWLRKAWDMPSAWIKLPVRTAKAPSAFSPLSHALR